VTGLGSMAAPYEEYPVVWAAEQREILPCRKLNPSPHSISLLSAAGRSGNCWTCREQMIDAGALCSVSVDMNDLGITVPMCVRVRLHHFKRVNKHLRPINITK
jgi:hypothetical protein